ncbi:M17 family metallopeptidase [Sphingomonas sp.]|uniref:leucyl aminopeptidase family protein n=1 Tax=Sphingomonas sp. TaxID=28214 RepID=UPI0025CDEED1|nr:leucyl aminopeptidase family protein [Sphingomonas sp.]
MKALFEADRVQAAITIHAVDKAGFEDWQDTQLAIVRTLLSAQRFSGSPDTLAIVPSGDGWIAVAGVKDVSNLSTWCLAKAAESLPENSYRLATGAPGPAALGWLLAQYRFDRYQRDGLPTGPRTLLTPDPARIETVLREAEAVALVRDLVNTPASDMGPPELEAEAARLAKSGDAVLTVTRGEALATGYPMIDAVGRAAARNNAPRLIEIEWGNPAHPRVAIVGKGVTFDSGGLDIKPSSGMRNMKKDMGGAAHALALAQLIIQSRLPMRLHLLIPAVENAIAGNAFRPGDILTSRNGLTVEIANTDAEGRLVLADALTRAAELEPVLIIDFATLTGAARVALGPDLPAMFSNDDELANAALKAGLEQGDPLWRLPLHAGYAEMLKSDVADLNNAPEGGFAGAVTAALFLQAFVPPTTPWLHLDTFAWRPSSRPGQPKGGEAIGLRAVWQLLCDRFAR